MKRPDYKVASVFKVKYVGGRVKITNRSKSKYISYDYRYNNTLEMAIEYLTSKGGKVVCAGSEDKYYIVMLDSAYVDEKHIFA